MAKILVADDDRLLLELMERSLATRGHEVEVFAGGAEACEALAERRYDLVISDLRMPGRGGLDVLRAAKEGGRRTPVILISGSWLAEERAEAERLGAEATLSKPVDLPYLFASVDRALGAQKEAPDAAEAPHERRGAPLVLVFDPDAATRKMLAYCMRQVGFRVTATAEAREAVELAGLEPPEAAIVSAAERDAQGVSFVEAVRRDPACARTYMVYLYAEDAVSDAVAALEAGADAALARPIDPEVLVAQLRAGIRRAAQRAAHGTNGNGRCHPEKTP
jgi:DNA-binding response OmpR family regulator